MTLSRLETYRAAAALGPKFGQVGPYSVTLDDPEDELTRRWQALCESLWHSLTREEQRLVTREALDEAPEDEAPEDEAHDEAPEDEAHGGDLAREMMQTCANLYDQIARLDERMRAGFATVAREVIALEKRAIDDAGVLRRDRDLARSSLRAFIEADRAREAAEAGQGVRPPPRERIGS